MIRFLEIVLLMFVILLLNLEIITPQNFKSDYSTRVEVNYFCDIKNGFNFVQQDHKTIGYIEYLKIGDKELKSDFTVTNPVKNNQREQVFGVMSEISWYGGYADPIKFTAQISVENKNSIADLLYKGIAQNNIEINFSIYEYDSKVARYYKAFSNNVSNLTGFITKSGGEFVLGVNFDQSMEVYSPKNHKFTLAISPDKKVQFISRHFSVTDSVSLVWGSPSDGTPVSEEINIPSEFDIKQNYPNPFNPSTSIAYSIPRQSYVSIKVYDSLGKEISTLVDEEKAPGSYTITFDGKNLASGFYFYRIEAGKFRRTCKMILLK